MKKPRPERLKNFQKYNSCNPKKFPIIPRVGDLWFRKDNFQSVWRVISLAKVRDMYMLAMEYPKKHLDTIIVFINSEEDGCNVSRTETLDDFLCGWELFEKKV